MAYLSNGKEQIQVQVGASLVDTGEKLGIPFSCTEGNCGTCLIKVVKGMEHLNPVNEQEEIFGLHDGERLLCQLCFKDDAPDNAVVEVNP